MELGCQSVQTAANQAHRNRSAAVSFGALHRALQNTELMTEGQNLRLKRRSLAKEGQESRRESHQRRRTRESKEEGQISIYQQLRGLREPQ
jgi:hypothetical protein